MSAAWSAMRWLLPDAQEIDSDSRFYLTLSMAYMGGIYNLLLLPVSHRQQAWSSITFSTRVQA